MTLEQLTWDQAGILQLATARGFVALGIPAGTIRRWASERRITALGKAPGGAHLYSIQAVSEVAETIKHTRRTTEVLANESRIPNT
jgi:hypothetical protein